MLDRLGPGAGLALIVLSAALLGIVLALIVGQNRRARRERDRLWNMLRRESEGQSQSVERLGRAVNDSLRQVAELSGALDARMEALTRQNEDVYKRQASVCASSAIARCFCSRRRCSPGRR